MPAQHHHLLASAGELAAYPGRVPRDTSGTAEAAGLAAAHVPAARLLAPRGATLEGRPDVSTIADLKVRYGRGGARLIKWIADPFALVGMYLVLVTLVLDRPGEAPGLSLACAVVPFQLVMATVANAMGAVLSCDGRWC